VRALRLWFENDEKQKAEVQTLGSSGEGMRLTDSVAVESVARFLVKVAVEGLFVKSTVVIRD